MLAYFEKITIRCLGCRKCSPYANYLKQDMSKINSKNLTYDNTLPPFLARLHATTSTDEHLKTKVIRSLKARNSDADAEDEPVYFDEETRHTLTKKEWELKESEEKPQEENVLNETEKVDQKGPENPIKTKRNTLIHGTRNKRVIGKVVGLDEGENHQEFIQSSKTITGNRITSQPNGGSKAKHRKKVKLSFDE